jgi:hypothetical protein
MPSKPAQANIAYQIIPSERSVLTVECDGTLESMQKLVGGYIEFVTVFGIGRNSLFVWEDGLIRPGDHLNHPWLFKGYPLQLVGKGLLVGGRGGVSCKLTHEQVLSKITWLATRP